MESESSGPLGLQGGLRVMLNNKSLHLTEPLLSEGEEVTSPTAWRGSDWGDVSPIRSPIRSRRGADSDDAFLDQFPLSTRGRHIVDARGERFRLKGVNWYGASDVLHVVGGLDVQSLEVICRTVHDLGFNVVRLPFSNEMLRSQVPAGAIDYKKNPALRGLSALQVYDETVRCLGRNHVAVIVNNHTTYGEFCGPPSKNSLWFEPNGPFTEEQWMSDWVMMAKRYSKCPHVVGFDLRNEIRPRLSLWPFWRAGPGKWPWSRRSASCQSQRGRGNWARAALAMAEQIQEVNPQALIVVERIVWPQRGLDEYAAYPGPLLPALAGRLVLGVHLYSWSGPGRFVPNWSVPPRWKWAMRLLRAVGIITENNYGDLSRQQLREQVQREFGHVLEADICPVWVSEFGADASNPEEMAWLQDFVHVLDDVDADWAYWPLNVGPKPGCGSDEAYGMVSLRWKPKARGDCRLGLLQQIDLVPLEGAVVDEAELDAGVEQEQPLSRAGSDVSALLGSKDPLRGVKKSAPELRQMVLSIPSLRRIGAVRRLTRTRTAGPTMSKMGDVPAEYQSMKKVQSAMPSFLPVPPPRLPAFSEDLPDEGFAGA